jgi:Flp pilus assembly protein TadD
MAAHAQRYTIAMALWISLAAPIHLHAATPPQDKRALEQLVLQDQTNVEAYLALVRIYRQERDHTLAVALMRNAEKTHPANEEILAQLGYSLIESGEYEEAVAVFDKLTAINHRSVAGYNGKGVAFDKAGNHTAAQELYQQALKIDADSAKVINNLAMSYILDLKPDLAISLLEPWSKRSDAPSNMQHNLALAYGLKGKQDKAHALNMETMSEDDAQNNQRFYERYSQMMQENAKEPRSTESEPIPSDAQQLGQLQPSAGTADTSPKNNPASIEADVTPEPLADAAPEEDQNFLGLTVDHNYPVARTR